MSNLCDKCGQPVEPKDDIVRLDHILAKESGTESERHYHRLAMLMASPRHIRCSPSRAQYIIDPSFEPVVDERPGYDKRMLIDERRRELEDQFTEAWEKLQRRNS